MCPLRRWCGLCAPPSAHSMHWLLSPPSTCHPTHSQPRAAMRRCPRGRAKIFQWYFTEVATFRYYETNFLNFKRALKHNSYKLITLTLSPQGAYLCGYVLPFSIQLIQANTFGPTISAGALFSYRGTHVFKEKKL